MLFPNLPRQRIKACLLTVLVLQVQVVLVELAADLPKLKQDRS